MKTSEQITYERLKNMIVSNHFPRGDFLSQRKLAKSVGATLITVRNSLRLLENDGLIENVPKWGVRIPTESEELTQERYYVRELLEVGAVDKMLDMEVPGARELLLKKAELCDGIKLKNSESFKEFAQKHADLHMTIARLSGNKILCQELNRLNYRSMMLSNAKNGWELHGENMSKNYHINFISRIFDSSHREALQAVKEHVRRGCSVEIEILRKSCEEHEEIYESAVQSIV